MSLNAAALKLMADKGLSIADVIEIAEAMESRTKNAERQHRYRVRKRNERDVTSNVTPPPYEDTSTPAPSEPKGSSGAKRAKPKIEIPNWVPGEQWEAFEEMRRLKKKPVSPAIAERLFRRLREIADAGWNIADVLDKSTVNCWTDVFMPEDGRNHGIRRANEPRAGPVNMDEYRERLQRIGKAEA